MVEVEQPSNIKPDSWYKEYIAKYNEIIYSNDLTLIYKEEGSFDQEIERLKLTDKNIDIFNKIHEYLEPLYREWHEIEKKIFDKRPDSIYRNSEEYKKDYDKMGKLHDRYWNEPPPGVSKEYLKRYHFVSRAPYPYDIDLIFNCNSLEKNKGIIEIFIYRINRLKEQPDIKKIASYKTESRERCILFAKVGLKSCKKALNQGYLVTGDLMEIFNEIKDYEYDDYCEEKRKHPEIIENLDFRNFSFTEDQLFVLIRKNEKWHDIDRDLSIYQERQKGKYLQELAENFGIKETAISMVLKKVQGAINYYQGKLFEDFVLKRLKNSNLFGKVVKEAGKGEADILAYIKDEKELFIYSLKNIKINRNPYWLTKEELRPELERAVLQKIDYKVHLILLVFDNYNNRVKQFEIDYNNPENIDIAGVSHV